MESKIPLRENDKIKAIQTFQASNYLELYKEKLLCDFCYRGHWYVGKIIKKWGEEAELISIDGKNEFRMILEDPKQISYFRHHTKYGNDNYENKKGNIKYLNDYYLILTDYCSNNFEKIKNMSPYDTIQFIGYLEYELEKVLNYGDSSKDLEISLKILYLYFDIFIFALNFYKENSNTFIEYENLQITEYRDLILVDKKHAMISLYEDILLMLNKMILVYSFFKLNFLNKYNFNKLYSNKDIKIYPSGIINYCKDEMYNPKNAIPIQTRDETFEYKTFQIAKFIDYFAYKGGFKLISEIITSKIEFSLNLVFEFMKAFQLYSKNVKSTITSVEENAQSIIKYIQFRIENLNVNELKETKVTSIINLILKTSELSSKEESYKKKKFENLYLLYYYRCLICNVLEKQLFAMNAFCKIILNIKKKRKTFISFGQLTETKREENERIERSFEFRMNFIEIAKFFNDKGVVDIICNENTHDEIKKKSFEIITMMYLCNWGIKEQNEINMKNQKLFTFLWNKAFIRKNDALKQHMRNYFMHFIPYLSLGHKLIFLRKLKEEIYNRPIIKENILFLKDFALKCLNRKTIYITKSTDSHDFLSDHKSFGLKVIWDIMQDKPYNDKFQMKAQEKIECIKVCIQSIREILSDNAVSDNKRMAIISLIFKNIERSESVVQSLDLLIKLLRSNDQYRSRYNHILPFANVEDRNTIENIVKDLDRYIGKVNEIEIQSKGDDTAKNVYEGNYSHSDNIRIRLMSIFILIQTERGIPCALSIFEYLYTICNNFPYAKTLFFQALNDNITTIPYALYNDFFINIILDENKFPIDNLNTYELFELLFFEYYSRKKKILRISKDIRVNFAGNFNLNEIERLWNLLTKTKDENIQKRVASLLCSICINGCYDDEIFNKVWEKFKQKIIEILKMSLNDEKALRGVILLIKYISDNTNALGPMITEKEIKLIEDLGDKSDIRFYQFKRGKNKNIQEENFQGITKNIKVYGNSLFYYTRAELSYLFQIPMNKIYVQFPGSARQFNMDDDFERTTELFGSFFSEGEKEKEKGQGDNSNKIEKILYVFKDVPPLSQIQKNPKTLLMSPNLISILQSLLREKNKHFIKDVWVLLKESNKFYSTQSMNVNKEWECLWNVNEENKSNKENEEHIKEIERNFDFDNTSIYYISYILNRTNSFISIQDKSFYTNVLFKSIIWNDKIKSFLMQLTLLDKKQEENTDNEKIEKLECLFSIMEIYIHIYIIHQIKEEKDFLIEKISQFLNEIFTISNDKQNDKKEIIEEINKVNESLMCFIIKDIELRNLFLNYCMNSDNMKEKLLFILIDCSLISHNITLLNSFYQFLYTVIDSFNSSLDENDKIFIIQFTYFLISNILSLNSMNTIIDKINHSNITSSQEATISQFFESISLLIQKTFAIFSSLPLNNPYYFNYDTSFINKIALPLMLNSQTQKIPEIFLSGLIRIIYEISLNHEINFIYNNATFDFSSYIMQTLFFSNTNIKINKSNLFLIQSPKLSSSIGLNSAFHLLVLLTQKDTSKSNEIINTVSQYNNAAIPLLNQWKFSRSENFKTGKFVGIKNLGCTCYMNSLFQIFFNMPSFRESIIQCECKNEKKNSLHQLKKIFSNLKYSQYQYTEASEFCKNFDNDVLNPGEQMDIDEFFVLLLDKIENRLKGTQNEDVIKYFFQGKYSDNLVFDGCNHHWQKEMSFYSIQLQVKNKNSLEESLDAMIDGEIINGDNSIYCQKCEKKICATKRQMFKVLPRKLLFVLKRFEFNYTKMTKIKLNDYYEFPLELDMTKYTTEYIENKKTSENNMNVNMNKNNMYKLKAIVIHIGSCEGGHYYDFIRDDESNEWYEFNDIKINKFDIRNLKKECFGGKEQFFSKSSQQIEEKDIVKSAYLLFYEKIDTSDCEKFDKFNVIPNCNEINIQYDNKEIIEELCYTIMNNYLEKIFFRKEYHMFILELLVNYIYKDFMSYNEMEAFLKQFCRTQNRREDVEIVNLRETPSLGSNLENYFKKEKIKLIINKDKDKDKESPDSIKINEIFQMIICFFFKVQLHSNDKTYLAGVVDLIRFCINKYNGCAEFIIEEFTNIDVMIEYLIRCPYPEIKNIIVGILNTAMVKIQNSLCEKKEKVSQKKTVSSDINQISPSNSNDESATKIPSEIQGKNDNNETLINSTSSSSEEKTSKSKQQKKSKESQINSTLFPQETLKLINNVLCLLYQNSSIENCEYIYYLIYRFTELSTDAIEHITRNYTPLLNYLYTKIYRNHSSSFEISDVFPSQSEHSILSSNYDIKEDKKHNYSSSKNSNNKSQNNNYAIILFYNLLLSTNYKKSIFQNINLLYDLMTLAQTKQAAFIHTKVMSKLSFENSDFICLYNELFGKFFDSKDVHEYQYEMMAFRRYMLHTNDSYKEERIKSCLKEYFKFIWKNKNIYSIMSFHTKFILKLFNQNDIMSVFIETFRGDIMGLIKWFKENPIPPEKYEIKGLKMFKNEQQPYYQISDKVKKEFDAKAEEESKEIIELLTDLTKGEYKRYFKYIKGKNEYNCDIDITDFKFISGDIVLYNSQKYIVVEFTDEILELELLNIDNSHNNGTLKQNQSTIWVETNDINLELLSAIPIPEKQL